jgi:acetyl esterase/lipase
MSSAFLASFAQRLMQAGVPTELHVYPGVYHGWEVVAPRARITMVARTSRIEALRRAMNRA